MLMTAATLMTSCYDDLELRQEIEGLGNEVEQIKTDIAQLKSDLAALKAAADKDLTVVELNKLADGYEIVFSDGTKAVIKNGKDGKDGLNGTNGKDGVDGTDGTDGTDGKNAVAPVVGVAEDEDGNLYWTVDGEWLLVDGEKVRANAVDGVDGAAGKPGADAKAPVVTIALDEDGYYYWQIDGEWLLVDGEKVRANGIDGAAGEPGHNPVITIEWSQSNDCWVWRVDGVTLKDQNGNVVPAQGPVGPQGDAFFRSIEFSNDGPKLVISIINPEYPDDTTKDLVYEIPVGVFYISFDEMEATGVTTEAKRFNYTISGVSANDEVIVRVLSTNATVYRVVPETNAKGYVEVELPSGEGYVDVYALNNTTGDFKAKSIKVRGTDFDLEETVSALHFSPAGDSVELPLTTGVEYEVVMSENGEDWLLAESEPRVKAVSYETLTLSAEANTTAADRKTTVTIRNKANTEKVYATFTINQKNYNPALISDGEKEIQWKESFGLYRAKPAGPEPGEVTKKGVFTFELSDDFSKGTYKVNNLFMAASYYGEGGRPVTSQGGVYYADLNDAGNLIVYRANSVASYGFTSDVVLNYDSVNNSFSLAEPVEATIYGDGFNRTGYLANYSAVVKVDEPAEDDGDPIAGTWNVTCKYGEGAWGAAEETTGTLNITKSGDTYTIDNFLGKAVNWALTQSGNTFTVSAVPEAMGSGKLVLTYDESSKTLSSPAGVSYSDFSTYNMSDIVATK